MGGNVMRAIAQNHNTEDNGARRDVSTASPQEQVTRMRAEESGSRIGYKLEEINYTFNFDFKYCTLTLTHDR